MTAALKWNNIRPIDNSLNNGFEELVCQLAAKEKISNQLRFLRIGKPDAGKECYWELSTGEMHAWQAKYFLTSPTPQQWNDITSSVKRVIDKHPNLAKYYISLPQDMPDPKVGDKISMLEKWKANSKKWAAYALGKGMSVTFEYWGASELTTRLAKKENEGLSYFFFNNEEITDEWLDYKNTESINALGARYTTKLNFELDIAKVFEGLSRDKDFEKQVHSPYKIFIYHFNRMSMDSTDSIIVKGGIELNKAVQDFRNLYEGICFIGNEEIPFNRLKAAVLKVEEITDEIQERLYTLKYELDESKGYDKYAGNHYNHPLSDISSLQSRLTELNKIFDNEACLIANDPILLLTGSAGMGKSHLLADIVERRRKKNQQSLLLLGENFRTPEQPGTQILHNQLRKTTIDEFTFLGALNAKAESIQSRIILFIDAINEGEGRTIWPSALKSFIGLIRKYKWLGLVISLRSSYINLIAPERELGDGFVTRIEHIGFAGQEYNATAYFFEQHDIIPPSSPLLDPEFQSPLFLKLFCRALQENGLHEVPAGYDGITKIMQFFLESMNDKLSLPTQLFYDPAKKLVQKAVKAIILKIAESEVDYISYEDADAITDSIFKGNCTNQEPYLARLKAEGIFNEDLHHLSNAEEIPVIYFAYQRFQDHLTEMRF